MQLLEYIGADSSYYKRRQDGSTDGGDRILQMATSMFPHTSNRVR